MTKIIQESTVFFLADAAFKNPYLRHVKFVFADDKPNKNNQAIPYEEFETLKASAVGMPIKMRFLGRRSGAGAHDGSIPIGHIMEITEDVLEDGTHRLIALGALYADEYPDIIEYLDDAYAANEAPGISWELSYRESMIEQGISWLKGVIARAATFVKYPAYGKRTALLALASDTSLSEEEMEQEVVSLFAKEPVIKGGTENVTLEEALAKIQELEAALAKASEEKTVLEASASKVTELQTTIAELETTVTELEGQITESKRAALVAERTQKATEAGLVVEDTELAQKQELWAAMSEEIFNEYISAVAAVSAKASAAKKAEASAKVPFTLPKISVDTSRSSTSTADLTTRMRALSRPEESAE